MVTVAMATWPLTTFGAMQRSAFAPKGSATSIKTDVLSYLACDGNRFKHRSQHDKRVKIREKLRSFPGQPLCPEGFRSRVTLS